MSRIPLLARLADRLRAVGPPLGDAGHLTLALLRLAGRLLSVPALMLVGPRLPPRAALVESLVRWLEDMGPIYVKLGQVLATRQGELPDVVTVRLGRLQDRARPVAARRIVAALEASLGRGQAEVFEDFEVHPLASGSVAQVHRARLLDGRAVAVKVVRPGAAREARRALSAAERLVRQASRLPRLAQVPLAEAFGEVESALLRQFDLRVEREYNERLRQIFVGDPKVRLPEVVGALSSSTVLVMEFFEGLVKVSDLGEPDWLVPALRTGFRALYRMILGEGLIHCDFHAGNVFFGAGGTVRIIDTGYMETLSESETYQFREFFLGILLGDGKRCSEILVKTATRVPEGLDRSRFDGQVADLVKRHTRARAAEFRAVRFSHELFAIQAAAGIRGSHRFTMAILAFVVLEGTAARYAPDLDFQCEALPILGPVILRRGFR